MFTVESIWQHFPHIACKSFCISLNNSLIANNDILYKRIPKEFAFDKSSCIK